MGNSISGHHALWRVADVQGGAVPQGAQGGRIRSYRHSRHGEEGQSSWSECTWRGSCRDLSALPSSQSQW